MHRHVQTSACWDSWCSRASFMNKKETRNRFFSITHLFDSAPRYLETLTDLWQTRGFQQA